MSKNLTSLLGDTPGRVVIKLVVFSLLVGIVMSLFGWTPIELFWGIVGFFRRLWNMGFSAFHKLFDVVIIGAAVVVPVFLLMRLLSWRK